jgi:hypothetical protein
MTNGIPCEECYEQPASGDTAGGTGVVLRLLSPDAEATSHRAIMHAW